MVPEYMTVQGKQIPYTRQPVAVADLELNMLIREYSTS